MDDANGSTCNPSTHGNLTVPRYLMPAVGLLPMHARAPKERYQQKTYDWLLPLHARCTAHVGCQLRLPRAALEGLSLHTGSPDAVKRFSYLVMPRLILVGKVLSDE